MLILKIAHIYTLLYKKIRIYIGIIELSSLDSLNSVYSIKTKIKISTNATKISINTTETEEGGVFKMYVYFSNVLTEWYLTAIFV